MTPRKPWKFFNHGDCAWVGVESDDDPSYYLTICTLETENIEEDGILEQDGYLIAAAPDLLAACVAMVAAYDRPEAVQAREYPYPPYSPPEPTHIVLARAAIAKAVPHE